MPYPRVVGRRRLASGVTTRSRLESASGASRYPHARKLITISQGFLISVSNKPKAAVVLVHGAWADASSRQKVIPFLHAARVQVVAVQNPKTSLADDVAATKRALDNIDGPIVLAGHSWGGTVITEAGNDAKVKALVFVAAFAPDIGESTGDQVGAHAAPPGLSTVSQDLGGSLVMSAEGFIHNVAQNLPEADARVLAATAPPLGASTFGDKVTQTAWATRPNWYVLSQAKIARSAWNCNMRW